MSSLNALSHEVNEKGYFLMIKTTSDIREIPVFASMWNMDGLILIGFCEADYESLRNQMRISFVVYDGYFEKCSKVVNLVIDHYDGGYQAGKYLKELGHKKALCLADNFICMDKERIEGFRKAFEHGETYRWEIPKTEKERMRFYEDNYMQLLKSNVTAVFAVSDFYALEFMRFLQGKNIQIPEDIQIIGFDDNMASRESNPSLTTIHQEANLYAPIKVENMILGGGIIRSGGNTKIIMIIDIVGTWCIGIPLCLLAAYVFKWGIVGVYTLLTTEELFRLAVSLIVFKRRKWIISLC